MRKGLSVSSIKNNLQENILCKQLLEKYVNIFSKISLYGVTNEKDESKQKYVIQMNLISVVTIGVNFITGILFFFIDDLVPGLMFLITAVVWISPIYLNRNGLKISSRLVVVFYSAIALILCSCWFSHVTMLDNYFLIVAINCNFMFSYEERKWLMISTFFCLLLFIIESTPLQNLLPAFNAIKDVSKTNIVLLVGQILMIILDVIVYVYLNRLRERNLLAKQKELEVTQRKVQIQNDDLKTFSIAASHSMQTPLYVSSFFLEKVKKEIDSIVSEDSKQSIDLIQSGLNQMDILVSGLFSYNRIINIEKELIKLDVFKEIDLVKKSIKPRYPNASILISSANQQLTTNQLLFSIIIYNLIDNALKYNLSKVPQVSIEVTKKNNRLILFVKDNGIGIPEKYFVVIFEPFKRIQVDTQIQPGNGLGLAGAKRAAERIGGSLICEKSDEYGTSFRLELPIE